MVIGSNIYENAVSIFVEGIFPKVFIIVNIRLFGSSSTPDYHVVVGVSEDEITTKKILEMHHKLTQA